MHRLYVLTRDVTIDECPWLLRTMTKDKIVYRFLGPTYGTVAGRAFTLDPFYGGPFFELPDDAVAEAHVFVYDEESDENSGKDW